MVQFKSQVNQDVVLHIFIVQRQRKLDEVTGRNGEADGLGGIPASPHHTRRKKRYSSTTEHDTGVNRGPTGCAYTFFCYGNISEQGIFLETKNLGGGDGGYTTVNNLITLLFIGKILGVEGAPMSGRKERKGVV